LLQLGFSDQVTAAGLRSLADEPGLPSLASLSLTGRRPALRLSSGPVAWLESPLDVPALLAVLRSPHRLALRTLSITDAELDEAAFAALASEPGLARLTILLLYTSNTTGAEEMQALAASPHLSPRCSLSLTPRRPLSPEAVRAVCALLDRPQPLRQLSLIHQDPEDNNREAPWLTEEAEAVRAALASIPGCRVEVQESGYSRGNLLLTTGDGERKKP
jgi:hypothetical protein